MATVTTSGQADTLTFPNGAPIARDLTNGRLYVIVKTGATTLGLFRSIDNGTTWGLHVSFTRANLIEWSSLVVDKNQKAHLAYRTGDGTDDTIYYRRCNLANATWGPELMATEADYNGGVNGSVWQGMDLAVVKTSGVTYNIAVAAARTDGTTRYGVMVVGIITDTDDDTYVSNSTISGTRAWWTSGTAPGAGRVSCSIEHNGDGFTSTTPHLWISWGRTRLNMVKCSWQGAGAGWAGPSTAIVIRTTIAAHNYHPGVWDGTRWLMGVISPDDTTAVRVYQRNQANTVTTTVETPTHPTGNITNIALSYDSATKNLRVYAVGTSTSVLYFVDYVRATDTWGAWATVSATAVLSSTEWGVRRGGNSGNAKYDVITTHTTPTPNTVVHTAQVASSPPAIPLWNTTAVPYNNGGAADVAANLLLDWDFSDPDPTGTQQGYALSRQIGAGTIQYYTAAGGTWGAVEVQNSSATSAVTLATAWGSGTDANHTYKVKVWDNGGVPSPGYSAALVLIPSVKVNPTITSPAAAAVLNTDKVTVTWTVAEQTTRRVRLYTNPGGLVVFDSDYELTSDLTYTVPYAMATGTGWTVEVSTRNNEGLTSTLVTRSFTVVYAPPPAPYSTFVPNTAQGWIEVTPVALAPVGAQAAIVALDLRRRPVAMAVLNVNSTMAGNVTGWFVGGGGTPGTLSYSTAQSFSAPGSARYVPPGAGGSAAPQVESSGFVQVVPGDLYMASAWIRPDTANKPIRVYLNCYDITSTYLASLYYEIVTPVAAAWHYLQVYGDPADVNPATTQIRVAVGEASTPATIDGFYADDIAIRTYSPDGGVLVARDVGLGTMVPDWGAAHKIDYEYQWTATGNNGTSVIGPWVA